MGTRNSVFSFVAAGGELGVQKHQRRGCPVTSIFHVEQTAQGEQTRGRPGHSGSNLIPDCSVAMMNRVVMSVGGAAEETVPASASWVTGSNLVWSRGEVQRSFQLGQNLAGQIDQGNYDDVCLVPIS